MTRKLACTKLTKQQYEDLIKDLKGKIFVLIMNIEPLLDKNGQIYDIGIAALKETRYNVGITSQYIHALERLGKLILVTQCNNTFDGQHYDLSSIECDFYDHDKKIDVALAHLPVVCKDIFHNTQTQVDKPNFDLRLKLLHSDVDNFGNVVYAPTIDTNKLRNAVEQFKIEWSHF